MSWLDFACDTEYEWFPYWEEWLHDGMPETSIIEISSIVRNSHGALREKLVERYCSFFLIKFN